MEEARLGSKGCEAAKARVVDEFLELLVCIPNVPVRKAYLKQFAKKTGLEERGLRNRMKYHERQRSRSQAAVD